MKENLMNSSHKATNKKSRTGYDKVRWEKERQIRGKWGEPESPDANEFFKKFTKF